jgi:hypothetical protein
VNLRLAQEKNTVGVQRATLQEAADLQARIIELQGQATAEVISNQQVQKQAIQDILEQRLDVLIDYNDTQKSVFERQAKEETRSFDERAALLQKAKDLTQASFEAQIAGIQGVGANTKILTELITEENAIIFAQKLEDLEVSEQVGTRVIEIYRERKLAAQDFAEADAELAKSKITKQQENGLIELNAAVELAKGKSSIEIGGTDQLVPTLELIKRAVEEGELDAQIEVAAIKLREGFSK